MEEITFYTHCGKAVVFFRHTVLISQGITMDTMTRGAKKNSKRLAIKLNLFPEISKAVHAKHATEFNINGHSTLCRKDTEFN